MPSIPRQLFLYTTVLFALTTQAAQDEKRKAKDDLSASSEARNFLGSESRQSEMGRHENLDGRFNELENNQRNSRYGIGYEMRQGRQTGAQGGRGRGR